VQGGAQVAAAHRGGEGRGDRRGSAGLGSAGLGGGELARGFGHQINPALLNNRSSCEPWATPRAPAQAWAR
jgi:hypothetical protein